MMVGQYVTVRCDDDTRTQNAFAAYARSFPLGWRSVVSSDSFRRNNVDNRSYCAADNGGKALLKRGAGLEVVRSGTLSRALRGRRQYGKPLGGESAGSTIEQECDHGQAGSSTDVRHN